MKTVSVSSDGSSRGAGEINYGKCGDVYEAINSQNLNTSETTKNTPRYVHRKRFSSVSTDICAA